MSDEKKISRKKFLGSLGLGAVGAALGGIGSTNARASEPAKMTGGGAGPTTQGRDMPVLPYRLAEVGRMKTDQVRLVYVAYDPEGWLYVAGAPGVNVYDAEQKLIRKMETPGTACAVATAPDGFVYVALRTEIQKFDREGKLVAKWGERGDAPGQMKYVTGLAVSERYVYVTDAGGRKILRFATDGDFVDEIDECEVPAGNPACCAQDVGPGEGHFVIPSGFFDCAVDKAGILHVGHTGLHRVERYDENAKLIGCWGKFGPRPEDFCGCCNPTNIALFPDGRVATSEKGVPRLKVYDPTGKLLAMLGPAHFPGNAAGLALAVNANNRIAMVEPVGKEVRFYKLERS